LQKEIVEWVLVEVLKILFIRMLLRKFQNVSISERKYFKYGIPLIKSKTGKIVNSKITKLAFQI